MPRSPGQFSSVSNGSSLLSRMSASRISTSTTWSVLLVVLHCSGSNHLQHSNLLFLLLHP
jgi:hypothetical protein